jgi:hypothetical protein
MPKSAVVREAILEFHARIGWLSERGVSIMLRAFDELVPQIPIRSQENVDEELAELRAHARPADDGIDRGGNRPLC